MITKELRCKETAQAFPKRRTVDHLYGSGNRSRQGRPIQDISDASSIRSKEFSVASEPNRAANDKTVNSELS